MDFKNGNNRLESYIQRKAREHTKSETEGAVTIDFTLFERKSENRASSSLSITDAGVEILIRLPFVSKEKYTKQKVNKILQEIAKGFEESTDFIVSGENTFPKASRRVWAPHIGIERTTEENAMRFIDKVIDKAGVMYG